MTPSCPHCGLVTLAPCETERMSLDCPHAPGARFTTGPLKGLKKWHYPVITADPPWSFLVRSDKGKDRSAENHYDVMDLDAIKALPVRDLAARDAILLMWVTDTHLQMGFDVLDAWGFTFKTVGFYWAKQNRKSPQQEPDHEPPAPGDDFLGMGFWTRANPEQCLLATRGKPKRLDAGVRKLIVAPVREHSRKPDQFFERTERLAAGPYAELFSRESRPGWDHMGNETGKFDPRPPVLPAPPVLIEPAWSHVI